LEDFIGMNVEKFGTIQQDVFALIEQFRDKSYPMRRIRAAQALEELRDRRAVDVLIEGLRDDSVNIRKFSAKALLKLADAKAAGALIERLRDRNEHWMTRRYAAIALGKIQGTRAKAALLEFLNEADPGVREAVRESYATINTNLRMG
jgi:HEAT repeat protein